MSKRENMSYDAEKDEYTCHCGRKLKFRYNGKSKSGSGYILEVSHYECEDCTGYPSGRGSIGK